MDCARLQTYATQTFGFESGSDDVRHTRTKPLTTHGERQIPERLPRAETTKEKHPPVWPTARAALGPGAPNRWLRQYGWTKRHRLQ
jgi:hypothetical protein